MISPHSRPFQRARLAAAAALLALLSACATGPQANPQDPLEPLNRGVFRFNEAVDGAVLKPVASAWRSAAPQPVRIGVGNFFNNLEDLWSFVNNVLQARPQGAAESIMRFSLNTVFGLGGVLDIASEAGIERHTEDFGQTLGRWGVPSGPYVVLPLLGPSTLRDAAALPVDSGGDAVRHAQPVAARNAAMALRVVDQRARLLRAGELIDEAALDKYSFVRDAHLQRRRALTQDD